MDIKAILRIVYNNKKYERIIERVVLILHRGAANQHQEMKQSTIITPSPTGRIDDYRNTVREK